MRLRRAVARLTLVAALSASSPVSGTGVVQGQALLPAPSPAGRAWVERTLASLTLEQKVAQLVVSEISGSYASATDPRLQRWVALARDRGVGAFVLYGGTPRDVAALTNTLQRAARVPLLITADFEGGPGQQVTGATEFPANMAFAAIGDTALMYRATSLAAREGRAMGIHLTYSPAVDIAWRPTNPAEGVRSFGGDLALLGRMVRSYVRGYHDNGMLSGAKHFPGRGDVEKMPARPDFTWNTKSANEVRTQEFVAFKHAIDAGVDYVMTEHVAVPSITGGSDLPASVEPKLARHWLRDSLGFKGMLTSDDLWYDHVIARFGPEEVTIRAFEAGHDLVLKPRDTEKTIDAMVAAVRSGRISAARIDSTVRRLLTLKARLNLQVQRLVDESKVSSLVGTAEHLAVAQEVADRSLTMLRNEGVLPLKAGATPKIVNISVQKLETDPSPAILAAKLAAAFPGARSFTLTPNVNAKYLIDVIEAAEQADLVIVSLFVARDRLGDATPIRSGELALIERIIAGKPKGVVAMSYGNVHQIRKLPTVPAYLAGYGERGWFGNQEIYFSSFIRALKGELNPKGRLPVLVSDAYPIGSGLSFP